MTGTEKGIGVRNEKLLTKSYVSYVKDLVVAGKEVEEAIKIIKRAEKEFS